MALTESNVYYVSSWGWRKWHSHIVPFFYYSAPNLYEKSFQIKYSITIWTITILKTFRNTMTAHVNLNQLSCARSFSSLNIMLCNLSAALRFGANVIEYGNRWNKTLYAQIIEIHCRIGLKWRTIPLYAIKGALNDTWMSSDCSLLFQFFSFVPANFSTLKC